MKCVLRKHVGLDFKHVKTEGRWLQKDRGGRESRLGRGCVASGQLRRFKAQLETQPLTRLLQG